MGSEASLSPLQMAVRALILFFVALVLIRIGGLRILGKKSAFDMVITIMLGAVLSRAVVGASPMLASIAASATMVVINRLLAWGTARFSWLNILTKGKPLVLYRDGQICWDNMKQSDLSFYDLEQSLRLETREQHFDRVEIARLETNGRISFVMKDN